MTPETQKEVSELLSGKVNEKLYILSMLKLENIEELTLQALRLKHVSITKLNEIKEVSHNLAGQYFKLIVLADKWLTFLIGNTICMEEYMSLQPIPDDFSDASDEEIEYYLEVKQQADEVKVLMEKLMGPDISKTEEEIEPVEEEKVTEEREVKMEVKK